MFDFVPFAGPRGKMTHGNGYLKLIRQTLQFALPEPQAVPIAAATVGRNQKTLGLGVEAAAFCAPPAPHGRHGELTRIMIRAHDDMTCVAR